VGTGENPGAWSCRHGRPLRGGSRRADPQFARSSRSPLIKRPDRATRFGRRLRALSHKTRPLKGPVRGRQTGHPDSRLNTGIGKRAAVTENDRLARAPVLAEDFLPPVVVIVPIGWCLRCAGVCGLMTTLSALSTQPLAAASRSWYSPAHAALGAVNKRVLAGPLPWERGALLAVVQGSRSSSNPGVWAQLPRTPPPRERESAGSPTDSPASDRDLAIHNPARVRVNLSGRSRAHASPGVRLNYPCST
jgi:hypothetical protein